MMKNAPLVRNTGARGDRDGERDIGTAAGQYGEAGEDVAADTEQAGMAERDQTAGGEQVEAQRKQREDRRLGDQLLGEEAREALGGERNHDEHDADRAADNDAVRHDQPGAEKRRAGRSPLGRKMSTSAMTR